MDWYTGSPVHKYTGTSVHRCTGTHVHQYTGIPVYWHTDTPGHRYTGTPKRRHNGTLEHRGTGTRMQVHWYTNTLEHRYRSTPVHQYTGTQVHLSPSPIPPFLCHSLPVVLTGLVIFSCVTTSRFFLRHDKQIWSALRQADFSASRQTDFFCVTTDLMARAEMATDFHACHGQPCQACM